MTSPRTMQMDFGGAFRKPPPATLALMVITGAVSVISMFDIGFGTGGFLSRMLEFSPVQVLDRWRLWTLFTYVFLVLDPFALLIYEALVLWMFAAPLERSWGQRRFLVYFFTTASGAAALLSLLAIVIPPLRAVPGHGTWVVGEAVILAWILMNWHATILLMFVIPVRAPYMLVLSLGLPALYALLGAWPPFVAPLTGMGIGYLLVGRRLSPRRAWLHLRAWWIDRQLKNRSRRLRVVPPPPPERDRDQDRPKYLN
ncbi:MAG: rhomboid family intramembrane serine protease [Deltaproteobacteria bacterium]|nr:rhomboid family intramembrane serine protease [Deltaproteobacteria bacterium]